jgi:hypothetical protein
MNLRRLAACAITYIAVLTPYALAQTAATGMITGTVLDPSKAAIGGAEVTVQSAGTNVNRKVVTNGSGSYTIPLVPPDTYSVTISAKGFKTETIPAVVVSVTETATVNMNLQLGQTSETVTVETSATLLQTENATMGRVVGEQAVQGLPLTNRNYTQILALSPGVAAAVTNAATLGRATQEMNVNGGRIMDNSYQMDGSDVSTMQTARGGDVVSAAGISIPNPDAIEEFKVQTGLYDASYGRGAGSSVNVVTKSGTNSFHGVLYEFLRNDKLNANDFFLNSTGQPRAEFKQNQFGGTVGGPIIKDKLFFFFAYQGTRQINGLGSSSLSTVILPALTNDRSAGALGKEFCGQKGAFGGAGVACDGSNINPVALSLLNFKLPNGHYIIPNPQVIQANGLGLSVFSVPSSFNEDQYIGNLDYHLSSRHTLTEKFFYSNDPEQTSFTAASSTPGFGTNGLFQNYNGVVRDTFVISPNLLNEVTLGFHRIYGQITTETPVNSAAIGLSSPSLLPQMPTLSVSGLFSLAGTLNDGQFSVSQQFSPQEQISWVKGRHNMRAGFSYEYEWAPFADPAITRGSLTFQSFPDFLLGASAAQNGSQYSNIFASTGRSGISGRDLRVQNYASYFTDDFKVSPRLTLNLGIRWEVFGQTSESHGYLVNFWPQLANNNFSSGGTYSGLVVAGNFPGSVPAGVVRNSNNTAVEDAAPLGNVGPRFGFAWQPLQSGRFVVRGGYGLYYTRTPINDVFQLIANQPLLITQTNSGVLNSAATFQNPFNPGPPPASQLPLFVARNATTAQTISTVDPDWRIPFTHQWALNTQSEIFRGWLLQVGYVGSRSQNVEDTISINQPTLASPSNPVNGITTNTLSNAVQRVPYIGFAPTGLSQRDDYGFATYHSLQASLVKRLGHGLQLQASYTFSKALTDVSGGGAFGSLGTFLNNIHNRQQMWGPADYDRRNRFVINYLYTTPTLWQGTSPAGILLSAWEVSGVTTLQDGTPLTFTDTRAGTIYGFSSQRAQICPGVTYGQIATTGSTEARLNNYFNANSFCAPPTVGNGFDFGNTGRGIVTGPGQANWDIAATKSFHIGGLSETGNIQFRAEFFNAFNTPQFANPGTNTQQATFGKITSSSVTPRLIQFALKYRF